MLTGQAWSSNALSPQAGMPRKAVVTSFSLDRESEQKLNILVQEDEQRRGRSALVREMIARAWAARLRRIERAKPSKGKRK